MYEYVRRRKKIVRMLYAGVTNGSLPCRLSHIYLYKRVAVDGNCHLPEVHFAFLGKE
jgi:hypothetical protein